MQQEMCGKAMDFFAWQKYISCMALGVGLEPTQLNILQYT